MLNLWVPEGVDADIKAVAVSDQKSKPFKRHRIDENGKLIYGQVLPKVEVNFK